MSRFTESVVEEAALAWLEGLGWHGRARPGHRARRAGRRARRLRRRSCWRGGCATRSRGSTRTLPAEALDDAFRKLTRPEGADAGGAQPRPPPPARRRRDGRVPRGRRLDPRRAGARARLRRPDEQRLAGGQPVHRRREQAQPPAGRRALRQRPAAGGDRAEERRPTRTPRSGRAFHQLQTYKARDPVALRLQRGCWSSPTASRRASARSPPDREWFKPWRTIDGRGAAPTRTCRELQVLLEGVFEPAPLPRPGPPLHRLRGRRAAARSSRRWPATTSSTPCNVAVERDAARRASCSAADRSREAHGRYEAGRRPAASRATGASAWSGTRRARARA